MRSTEEERRWFVTLSSGIDTEDVGADECGVSPAGALVFHRNDRTPTFIYAPGTWKFVEFQGDE
jgi:hypothetical protein